MNSFEQNNTSLKTPAFQGVPWSLFAFSEGILKTLQLWLLWVISLVVSVFPIVFIAVFVVGIIQIVGGLIINLRSRYEIFPGTRYIMGSLLLGIVSVYMIILPIYIFSLQHTDFSLLAFVIALAIIPGVLLEKVSFRDAFRPAMFIAIILFFFGTYAFLGFPSLEQLVALPKWILLSFTLPAAALINEFIVRSFKTNIVSPWVNNFWAGAATAIVCVVAFLISGQAESFFTSLSLIPQSSWLLFLVLGFLVLSGVFVRQRTYMHGGSIASKKIVMTGMYLVSAFLVGLLVFSEALTVGKVVGIIALLGAYIALEPHLLSMPSLNSNKKRRAID